MDFRLSDRREQSVEGVSTLLWENKITAIYYLSLFIKPIARVNSERVRQCIQVPYKFTLAGSQLNARGIYIDTTKTMHKLKVRVTWCQTT